MAVNDIWRASLVGDWGAGNEAVVTFHFRAKTDPADPNVGVGPSLETYVDTYISPVQSNQFNFRYINFLRLKTGPPLSFTYTGGFPRVGDVASDSVGQQLAAILTTRTPYAGRSYRGREYWPAIPETMATNIGPTGTVTSALQNFATAMIAEFGASGSSPTFAWVVYSKKLDTYNTIETCLARSVWGVIRRRRSGVGS